jgi:hypothetical protein
MARRTQIIDGLVDHLAANTDALLSNVSKRFAYLHEVNDFPAITLTPQGEQRIHRGANNRQGLFSVFVRGYVYSEEDTIGTAEQLAKQIEEAADTFAADFRNREVEECRVISVRTDDGLMKPYGMCDVQIQILYEVSDAIK